MDINKPSNGSDIFFNGDSQKWIKVANSLKDELGPFCSAVMWNEIEHLGTDHSQDERMSELLQIVKS